MQTELAVEQGQSRLKLPVYGLRVLVLWLEPKTQGARLPCEWMN
jgi:hypothetical protein